MNIKLKEIVLLYITILLNHISTNVTAMNATHVSTSLVPTPSHTISSVWTGMSSASMATMTVRTSHGTNQTQIGTITQSPVRWLSSSKVTPIKTAMKMSQSLTIHRITTTSSVIPKSPSTVHLLSPSTSHVTANTSSPSPTHKTPKTTTSSQPWAHKVGLIVGIVLGLVLVSVCLLVFHKRETRIKCLKLMCRPCTRSYSSRYNIVPIYVYDDTEQDIRELQDDSDLPLV